MQFTTVMRPIIRAAFVLTLSMAALLAYPGRAEAGIGCSVSMHWYVRYQSPSGDWSPYYFTGADYDCERTFDSGSRPGGRNESGGGGGAGRGGNGEIKGNGGVPGGNGLLVAPAPAETCPASASDAPPQGETPLSCPRGTRSNPSRILAPAAKWRCISSGPTTTTGLARGYSANTGSATSITS